MVTIANPIYDSVFKYMMEDLKVAKVLISALIGYDVLELSIRNNDLVQQKVDGLGDEKLCLYRIDFGAAIRTAKGKEFITIEVQKAFRSAEIERFRKYLGIRYVRTEDDYEPVPAKDEDGNDIMVNVFKPSHIIAIYILGDRPLHKEKAVIYGRMGFTDPEGKSLELSHDMIKALTHDFIAVQVPNLPAKPQSKVERIMSVFDQSYVDSGNTHVLNYEEQDDCKEEISQIIRRLQNAAASKEVRKQMEDEDLAIRAYQQMLAEQAIARKELADSKKMLAENKKVIAENKKMLAENKKEIAEKNEVIAENEKVIAENKKEIAENKKEIDEKNEVIAENEKELAKKNKELAEKNGVIVNAIKALLIQKMSSERIAAMLGVSVEEVDEVING